MRVQVTKSFDWAPNGTHVRTVAVGEVLEGRGAEVALELKSGTRLGDLVRLPLLGEYLASGYATASYEAFIAAQTTAAKAQGGTVEVRLPTADEVGGADKLQELLDRIAAAEVAEAARVKAAEEAGAKAKADEEAAAAARAAREDRQAEPAPTPPASPAPTPPAAPHGKRRGR